MELPLLPLFAVLASAFLAGKIAERIGYPSVLGELLAGIVLGPPLLGILAGDPALQVIAQLGILLMMLYVGMEIDPAELKQASKGGILAALGGFITPFVLSYWVVTALGGTVMEGLFVGMAAGVTSLATKSRILLDLKLLDTRIAHVMMAGALLADALSLIIFAGLVGAADPTTDQGAVGIAIIAGKMILFFGGTWALGTFLFPRLGSYMQRMGTVGAFPLILLIMIAFAEAAHLAGAHGILGAFLAGIFLRENVIGQTVSRDVMTWVRRGAVGFLAPVFFVTAGFEVDLAVIVDSPVLLGTVILVATVGKIVGTAVFYLPTGYGWREGLVLGAGMNGRGAVEIIIAQIGLSLGIISQEMFSVLVLMAIVTTATVPVFLKWGVAWLRNRGELVTARASRSGVIIAGGGPINQLVGKVLSETQTVTIVDTRLDHCEEARAVGLQAIQGSALDDLVMQQAGAARAAFMLAQTGNPGVDALAAKVARNVFGVPEVSLLYDESRVREEAHVASRDHVDGHTAFGGSVDIDDWDRAAAANLVRTESITAGERSSAGTHLLIAVRKDGDLVPASSGVDVADDTPCIILVQTQPS